MQLTTKSNSYRFRNDTLSPDDEAPVAIAETGIS